MTGIILGVVQIALFLLATSLPFLGNTWLTIVIWAAAFLVAGIQAAQQTGRLGTGVLAGFWTPAMAGVLALAYEVLMVLTNLEQIRSQMQQGLNQAGL